MATVATTGLLTSDLAPSQKVHVKKFPEAFVDVDLNTAVPACVQGAVDGIEEKTQESNVEQFKRTVEPYKEKFGTYISKIWPWREFVSPHRPQTATVVRAGLLTSSDQASCQNVDVQKFPETYVDVNLNTRVPAIVNGAMDGIKEKPQETKMEQFKRTLEPYKEKYGTYLSKIRPWREFVSLSRPQGDARKRMEGNLTYYQINYAAIFLLLMISSILMNPKCLVVVSVLVLVWMAFLKNNDDPSWQVRIAGLDLGKTQRWAILNVITAIALFCVVGGVFFHAAWLCSLLVLAHCVLHPVPEAIAASEFDEVTDVI